MSPTTKAPQKKWRRRSDARPKELSAAAFQLFAEQGFAATRLEDVAARAGVSKGTIYRYFESKEALFAAVITDAVAPRFAEAEILLEAYEGSSEDLLRTFFKIVRQGLDGPFPAMIKLVISESGNFPQLAQLWADLAVKRVFSLIAQILKRGVERGEFRPIDIEATVPLVGAPLLMLALFRQTFQETQLPIVETRTLDAHIEMLLLGLAPRPARSKGKSS